MLNSNIFYSSPGPKRRNFVIAASGCMPTPRVVSPEFPPENFGKFSEIYENFRKFLLKIQYKPSKYLYICLHLLFLSAFTAPLCTNSNIKTLLSWLIVLIDIACMLSLRSTLVPGLSVIFTIPEYFRKFPASTKFTENLQPYLCPT